MVLWADFVVEVDRVVEAEAEVRLEVVVELGAEVGVEVEADPEEVDVFEAVDEVRAESVV